MIPQFALRLVCGLALMWLLMPRRQISSGFFRIQLLVTLGLAVLTALSASQLPLDTALPVGEVLQDAMEQPAGTGEPVGQEPAAPLLGTAGVQLLAVLAAVVSFVGSVLWTLERRTAGTVACGLVFALSAVALLGGSGILQPAAGGALLSACAELSSAALLGSIVAAMLLGHWYLTAPTMSHDPLWRMTLLVGIATVLRLVASLLALFLLDGLPAGTPAVWLALRWLAGIAGPLAVAVMTWRILRYRNTQSATGVLFVGVILVFIGEMSAALLQRELGLPL